MSDLTDKENSNAEEHEEEGLIPFYPLHMMKEIMVTLGIFTALLLMAAFLPAHLQAPADPFTTPQHIKPEWFFLPAYQMLKYFPNGELFSGLSYDAVGILLMNFGIVLLFFLPFLDRYQGKAARKRPLFLVLGIIVLAGALTLGYLGYNSGHRDVIFHMMIK